MKVLVINCGSSSLKYQLIDMDGEAVLCKGLCERIGIEGSKIVHKAHGKEWEEEVPFPTHTEAFMKVVEMMTTGEGAVVKDKSEISAIGHRVVQGAEFFTKSEIVTDAIIDKIEEIAPLAPVHNMAHVQGLRSAKAVFGASVPNVVVFDTTFHQTMPPKAYMYGVPYEMYEKYSIRRYGAHGTSHRYEWQTAKELLGETCHRVLSCHLGNGSSLCAIEDGVVRDTTMGLTPLDGLMMGTRCGSIDPATVCYLQREGGYTCDEVDTMMNKQSGFLAISENTSDVRDIRDGAAAGDEKCLLALDMFIYKVVAQGAAMIASMSGVDTITFTGGIGENDWATRQAVCECFEWMGVRVDREKNKSMCSGKTGVISTAGSSVTVMVLPTDEEYMIACDVERLAK